MFLRPTVVLLTAALVNGCITYKDYPKDPDVNLIQAEERNVVVRLEGYTMGEGDQALVDMFRADSPFTDVEFINDESMLIEEGLFIDVEIENVPPTMTALAFGYLSVSTLTILPFWSTRDGSNIFFTVYEDGERQKTYDYEVRRAGFVWILMLPLIWVNALTPSEPDAFEAVLQQFFIDLQASEI